MKPPPKPPPPPRSSGPPGPPGPDELWALFLDVDGTLIEIAESPDGVVVDARVTEILAALDRRFDHAVALVSGRPIEFLDRLFAPLRLTTAGLHGLERRDPAGRTHRPDCAAVGLDRVRDAFRDFTRRDPGLMIEDKTYSVALHFRRAPTLADGAAALAERLARDLGDDLILQRGKMVLEFRPRGPHKGDVVDEFMAMKPFAGRVPVFIGDDVTDEDGFMAVNRLSGHSIRVGASDATAARWRIDGVPELRDWLAGIALMDRS